MKKVLYGAAIVLAAICPAYGQSSDPRALTACQVEGASFVQINKCLPDAHVAFAVLDAFSAIYPSEAAPLRERCLELNEEVVGAAVCVGEAIEAAIELASRLPTGATLDDPIFEAVKSTDLLAKLKDAKAAAQAEFPDHFWGGTMYQAYH